MIRNSLLFTSIFICLYITLFGVFPVVTIQDMQHGNIYKAQDYIFRDKMPQTVLVGSSLSERIKTEKISGVYSLAFSGLSILDGIEVIRQKKVLPKTIIVEINVLEKGANPDFLKSISNPLLNFFRAKIPALRADARPIAYAMKIINYPVRRIVTKKKDEAVSVNLNKSLIENQIKEYSNLSDTSIISSNFNELKYQIKYLESKGCRIIFLEMPVDSALQNLPRVTFINTLFRNSFKSIDYDYIYSRNKAYETTDGIHLTEESANKFTEYLIHKMENIGIKNYTIDNHNQLE